MYSSAKLCKTGIIIIFAMIILGFSQLALSQVHSLEIKVGDVIACPGQTNVEIPIYLENYTDTVAGFNLWLQLSRPDIMEFQLSLETIEYTTYFIYTEWDTSNPPAPTDSVIASTYWVCDQWDGSECISSSNQLGYYKCLQYYWDCIDSVFVPWQEGIDAVHTESIDAYGSNFDTVGTLTQGWEMVTTRSLAGNGYNIQISGMANQANLPIDNYTAGIGYPQGGQIPLIKVIADVYLIDETMVDRDVEIIVEYQMIDNFGLSDERGQALGVTSVEVEDISYFMCEQWADPPNENICLYWNRVSEYKCPTEGCDSMFVDTIMHTFVDVDRCCLPMSVACNNNVSESECPDEFGGTGVWFDGCISITDGSLYVKHCVCGDLNDDGMFNILDIIFLINHKYKKGPAPEPIILADTDGDGRINILDIVCLISAKYKFGNCCDDPSWLR